jgi:hypothetical protein
MLYFSRIGSLSRATVSSIEKYFLQDAEPYRGKCTRETFEQLAHGANCNIIGKNIPIAKELISKIELSSSKYINVLKYYNELKNSVMFSHFYIIF